MYSVLAGMCIGIGGVAYLVVGGGILGSVLFCVGLYTILTFGFHLFTGKCGNLPEHGLSYLKFLSIVWIGNLAGTSLIAFVMRVSGSEKVAGMIAMANTMTDKKLELSYITMFTFGILCNFLMYVAVENFCSNPHELGKYLGIFFAVVVFIACGFEHSIANMFFFGMAGRWGLDTAIQMMIVTAGNVAGASLIPYARQLAARFENI